MKTTTRSVFKTQLIPALATAALFLCAARPVMAQDVWTGSGATDNWSNPTNWQAVAAPLAYDSLTFSGANTANINNFTSGTAFDGITFGSGSSFNLNGNSILLSGNISGITTGVANTSGGSQTVSLNLNLDWGYHTFVGGTGGLVISGTLTPNAGGVAFFDPNVTSSTLATDGTGLISGLDGAGLMFNTSTGAPTNLATISSGLIQAYMGYAGLAGGATSTTPVQIGNGNNLNLTSTGANAFYSANNNTVNSISVAQVGTITGSATTTLTITNTLVFGANGGIYVLNASTSGTGAKSVFSLASANASSTPPNGAITAGTSGPATIVFATAGNNPSNQVTIGCTISNNAGGGPVTAVITGPGSVLFGTATNNSYTGGTYVTQGQLQVGKTNGAGFGPIYVAENASIYFQNTGIYPNNNFYLSPGNGSPNAAVPNGGSLLYAVGAAGVTNGGVITLQGAAVTSGPGDRLTLNGAGTLVFTNQITGTGTLDIFSLASGTDSDYIELRNQTANANNWQGGLIIEPQDTSMNLHVREGADNQIPNGVNAGNLTIIAPGSTAGATVQFDVNGHKATINALIAPANHQINQQVGNFQGTGPGTLTLGAANAGGTFNGQMYDQGGVTTFSLVKIGAGTQTLVGTTSNYTYHGNTTISNGTLALSGSALLPNSPVISLASGTVLDASTLSTGGLIISNQTLAGIGSVYGGTTITNGTINPFFGTIGTLNLNPEGYTVTLAGGSTYVWDMNNATGTPGGDPGWGLLSVTNGYLQITATPSSPVTIKITSLTSGDVAGSATWNSSTNNQWMIVQNQNALSGGFTANDFIINASAFTNDTNSSDFSVTSDGTNIYVTYTAAPVITNGLTSETNNQGSTVSFTVGAAGNGITYQWFEGATALVSGGTSLGGATVTITTNAVTGMSTLTLSNITGGDTGNISVDVTNSVSSGTANATLTVIVPPSFVSVSSSYPAALPLPPIAQGAAIILTATPFGGTGTTGYQWFLNNQPITNANSATYIVNVAPANEGSYTVWATNSAGHSPLSSPPNVLNGSLETTPNQMLFEPFNYVFQPHDGATVWDAVGTTNLYNQATGVGVAWVKAIGGDADCEYPNWNQHYAGYPSPAYYATYPQDYWPWYGLADSFGTNETTLPGSDGLYTDTAHNADLHLSFGPGGSITNGPVYFSFVENMGAGSALTGGLYDYMAGFGYNDGDPTTVSGIRNAGIFLETIGDSYRLGAFKTSTAVAATGLGAVLLPTTNGNWASGISLCRDATVLVVCRLTVDFTNVSSVAMWIDPPVSSFGASEANVPTPDVPDSNSTNAADVAPNASADYFYFKNTASIPSRTYATLRVGTTWASVTSLYGPVMNVVYNNPNVVVSWSTNWYGYTLQEASSLYGGSPPANIIWTDVTPTSTNSGNYIYSTPASSSSNLFFQVIGSIGTP